MIMRGGARKVATVGHPLKTPLPRLHIALLKQGFVRYGHYRISNELKSGPEPMLPDIQIFKMVPKILVSLPLRSSQIFLPSHWLLN